MSDRKAVAKQALRSQHATLAKSLDPSIAAGFYAASLITDQEKETVEAQLTSQGKNIKLLNILGRRDPVKVLDTMTELLEGEDGEDKETNELILQKIEKAYPYYSYDNASKTDEQLDQVGRGPKVTTIHPPSPPSNPHIKIPPLPKLDDTDDNNKDLSIHSFAVKSVGDEGADGGGKGSKRNSYPMNSYPKGICVIVNNENFVNMKARAGSYWDADALEELFGKHLGFHMERFDNLSTKQIRQLLENIRAYDHSKLCCLFFCVLTHGVDGQLYGTDGDLIGVLEITRTFTGTRCPTLAGKPKVFLLQACRGGKFDHGVKVEQTDSGETVEIIDEKAVLGEDETDGGGYEVALPDESDFLLAYATTPGFVSWRNSAFGTWFIKAFTDTMRERADSEHLMDILTEVNRIVAEEYHSREHKKQMPAPVTMLRYKLYLPSVKQ